MADKITTSTGRVVWAKYTGHQDDGAIRLYRCYDLCTTEYLGWCACNAYGQFGPICKAPFFARRRMENVVRTRSGGKPAYSPWVAGILRALRENGK